VQSIGEVLSSDEIKSRLQSADWIKKIQQTLNGLGFDAGTADGVMGSKTKNAILEFQKARGLTPDGVVGRKTWEELSKSFPQTAPVIQPEAAATAAVAQETSAPVTEDLGY
jgi:peptidoglycan hydrolase-like protein with peptidoglycan-binding domain